MVSLAEVLGLGKALARRAEARIHETMKKYGPLPVVVSFSGGKDSSAALAVATLALGTGPILAYFVHIPGQTHRDNVMAARRVADALGLFWETVVWEPGRPLPSVGETVYHVVVKTRPYWELLAERGPPAPPPRPRWCCKIYKEEPLGYAPCAPTIIEGRRVCARIVIVGVKRNDSKARARRWPGHIRIFKRKGSVDIAVAPLVDFTNNDVWILLKSLGIDDIVRPQYKRWGRSPNCVLCPLASRRQLELAVSRLPTPFLEKYARALKRWDSSLARRMRGILEAELERRKGLRSLGLGEQSDDREPPPSPARG